MYDIAEQRPGKVAPAPGLAVAGNAGLSTSRGDEGLAHVHSEEHRGAEAPAPRLLPYELLDHRQRVLHVSQALLGPRTVARAHRQPDRPLLAGQAVLGSADIVRKRDTLNGQLSLSLGQTHPVLGGAPHYRAVVLHELRLSGG